MLVVLDWEGEAGGAGRRGLLPASLQPDECPGKLLGGRELPLDGRAESSGWGCAPCSDPRRGQQGRRQFSCSSLGAVGWQQIFLPCLGEVQLGLTNILVASLRSCLQDAGAPGCPQPCGCRGTMWKCAQGQRCVHSPSWGRTSGGTHAWRCLTLCLLPTEGGILAPPHACTAPSRPA